MIACEAAPASLVKSPVISAAKVIAEVVAPPAAVMHLQGVKRGPLRDDFARDPRQNERRATARLQRLHEAGVRKRRGPRPRPRHFATLCWTSFDQASLFLMLAPKRRSA
jgi:hypothetical protein